MARHAKPYQHDENLLRALLPNADARISQILDKFHPSGVGRRQVDDHNRTKADAEMWLRSAFAIRIA